MLSPVTYICADIYYFSSCESRDIHKINIKAVIKIQINQANQINQVVNDNNKKMNVLKYLEGDKLGPRRIVQTS